MPTNIYIYHHAIVNVVTFEDNNFCSTKDQTIPGFKEVFSRERQIEKFG